MLILIILLKRIERYVSHACDKRKNFACHKERKRNMLNPFFSHNHIHWIQAPSVCQKSKIISRVENSPDANFVKIFPIIPNPCLTFMRSCIIMEINFELRYTHALSTLGTSEGNKNRKLFFFLFFFFFGITQN